MELQISLYIYILMHIQIPKSDEPPQSNLPDQRVNFLLFRFTWVKLPIYPPSQSLKWSQQLYIIYSFTCYPAFCVVIWSWAAGQVSHTFIIYLFIYLSISSCCASDCILLLLLCCWLHIVVVVVYHTTTTTTRKDIYKRSLVGNIKRLIVKQITFTSRCSVMADLSIYIYIYEKTYCESNKLYCYM